MPSQPLVLSADTGFGRRLVDSLGVFGTGSLVVTRWTIARALLARANSPVVIFDADRPIADVARVVEAGSHATGRVIVLAHGLDSEHWLAYIRAGAFDVLPSPVDPTQLREAVRAAERSCGVRRPHASRWFELLIWWRRD